MKLSDLTLANVHKDQHRAVMRLILRMYGETHRIFRRTFDVGNKAIILSTEDADGFVDATQLSARVPSILNQFQRDMQGWLNAFERARQQAANIALGGLVVSHNAYVSEYNESLLLADGWQVFEERRRPNLTAADVITPQVVATATAQAQREGMTTAQVQTLMRTWMARRNRALEAAAQRVQSDGLVLSNRIWNLENGGLQQIRNTLLTAFSERTSAARLAGLLESALGAGKDCPKWTEERLYSMDARDRARSTEGLLRGDECRATGISYNALRLARTELQYAHNQMAMDIYRASPWVSGYKVRLSPAHPRIDICDTLAAGGPYDFDNLVIPAHPNCLCYVEPVLMPVDDFRMNVRRWLAGENRFLDDYQTWLGIPDPLAALPWTTGLAESLELWLNTSAGGQAAALGV